MGLALEEKYPIPTLPNDVVGVVMLGGTFDLGLVHDRGLICYNSAGGRLVEFVRFIKKHPHLRVVFTGGGRLQPGTPSEAEMTKTIFDELGLSGRSIVYEGKSRNTTENALFSHELVKPDPTQKWVLMTSAFHLPRAVALFETAGWNVIPYPVDYHLSPQGFNPLNLMKSLQTWYYSMAEWAGLLKHKWFA